MIIDFLRKIFRRAAPPLSFFGRTDTGRMRGHNEDTFAILQDRQLFIVADGMGGHNAGEVASATSVETLAKVCNRETVRAFRGNHHEIRHFLTRAFHQVNEVVMTMAEENASRHGMGCTLIACLVENGNAHIVHVGDSRCYYYDDGGFVQVTTDHSITTTIRKPSGEPGAQPGEDTLITRTAVTRAVGFPFPEDPEYHCIPLKPGRRLLFCTDGLWSMVDDETIGQILADSATPEEACDRLVHEANDAGGRDNITVLVLAQEWTQ